MFGSNNSFIDWIKEHGKAGIVGFLLVALAACGVGFPMNAIDNTNEAQALEIAALQEQVGINAEGVAANAEGLVILANQLGAHLIAYATYTENTDAAIAIIQADILAIDAWMTKFYNTDTAALGEWQEFMAVWDAFYDEGFDSHGVAIGEFQRTTDQLYAVNTAYSTWWAGINARLAALEAAP